MLMLFLEQSRGHHVGDPSTIHNLNSNFWSKIFILLISPSVMVESLSLDKKKPSGLFFKQKEETRSF